MAKASLIRGRAMRVTRLNGCGNPVLGPDSVIVTEGFITVTLTPNTSAGDAITVTNAAGNLCVNDTPTPKFINWTVEIALCGVDPELLGLLTGQPVVLNAAGDEIVGFRQNSKVDVDLTGFALELWTGVASDACDASGEASFGYLLIPFLKGGVTGNISVANASIDFTVSGAASKDGSGWGVGPYDVTRDEASNEGPLNEVITAGDHLHMEVVSVPPPEPTEGGSALGVPATGATAGTPGTFTPAMSYAPLNLADMVGKTASPTTAWTTGQSVVLRDGSRAHWSGTAWVAGPA